MVALLVGIGVAGRAGAQPTNKPQYKPALNVESLMEGQDFTFRGLKKSVTASKWHDATVSAWILAELANANIHHAKDDQYAQFAEKMSQTCAEAAKIFKKHDTEEVKKAVADINTACKNCHDQYRKKKEGGPPTGRIRARGPQR